jgi:hypothetical protein
MSEGSYDDRFAALEEESRGLVSDVHELAQFTKLNFTGFIKIVKVRGHWGLRASIETDVPTRYRSNRNTMFVPRMLVQDNLSPPAHAPRFRRNLPGTR